MPPLNRDKVLPLVLQLAASLGLDPMELAQAEGDPVATTIAWSTSAFTLSSIGQAIALSAHILDQFGNVMLNLVPTYSSDTSSHISVTGSTATAVANGSATITAAYAGLTSRSIVCSVSQQVASITGVPSTLDGTDADNATTFSPAYKDALGNVVSGATGTLTSDQPSIISVSGLTVTPQSAGDTTLRLVANPGAFEFDITVTITHAGAGGTDTLVLVDTNGDPISAISVAPRGTASLASAHLGSAPGTDILARLNLSLGNTNVDTLDPPTITAISPATIQQGASGTFALTGTHLDELTADDITNLPSGVVASSYAHSSPTAATVTLTASSTADVTYGLKRIMPTLAGRGATAGPMFSVTPLPPVFTSISPTTIAPGTSGTFTIMGQRLNANCGLGLPAVFTYDSDGSVTGVVSSIIGSNWTPAPDGLSATVVLTATANQPTGLFAVFLTDALQGLAVDTRTLTVASGGTQTLDHLTLSLSDDEITVGDAAPTLTLHAWQDAGETAPYTDDLDPAPSYSGDNDLVAEIKDATSSAITMEGGTGTVTFAVTAGGKSATAALTVDAAPTGPSIVQSTPWHNTTNGTAITPAFDVAPTVDNMMLCIIRHGSSDLNLTGPSGWTRKITGTIGSLVEDVWYRKAQAGDGTSYTWTSPASETFEAVLIECHSASGFPADPFAGVAGPSNVGNTSSPATPATPPTVLHTLAFAVIGDGDDQSNNVTAVSNGWALGQAVYGPFNTLAVAHRTTATSDTSTPVSCTFTRTDTILTIAGLTFCIAGA